MSFKIIPFSPPFSGHLTVPGDKSISHRALILAGISNGVSILSNLPESEDVQATRYALENLGVKIETLEPGKIRVYGRSGKFSQALGSIDCGNSGTTMRLMAGVLAGQPFSSRLTGDTSLQQRPMERIMIPLRQMEATLEAEGKENRPPLVMNGKTTGLSPLHDYLLPIPSAQLKSSLLLAALFAKGSTTIIEPTSTRDHTERLFESFQISFEEKKLTHSKKISLLGPQIPRACNLEIPGDISSAAFWIIAAASKPGSHLTIKQVGLNPTRTGFLNVLKRMHANREQSESLLQKVPLYFSNEPKPFVTNSQTDHYGDIVVQGSLLTGTIIKGDEIPGVIDELPILAVAGALAQGTTIIRDARELRVKESDRIMALVYNLRAMGVSVIEYDDGLQIQGGSRLQGAALKSFGDHRIAMAFFIAGLFAEGSSTMDNASCIATSYPGFAADFEKIIRQSS